MNCKGFGSVCDGKVGVSLVEPTANGRGTARVELWVYGARYPYKLSAGEACKLGAALLAAADELANPVSAASE